MVTNRGGRPKQIDHPRRWSDTCPRIPWRRPPIPSGHPPALPYYTRPPAGKHLLGLRVVGRDLPDQLARPRKRALLTDPFHELHGDLAPREIAVEVEQKRLHRHLARPKRRPPSHVGGAAVPARPGVDRGRVDAERRQDLARRRGQVGRWKADRPPAAVAPDHRAAASTAPRRTAARMRLLLTGSPSTRSAGTRCTATPVARPHAASRSVVPSRPCPNVYDAPPTTSRARRRRASTSSSHVCAGMRANCRSNGNTTAASAPAWARSARRSSSVVSNIGSPPG